MINALTIDVEDWFHILSSTGVPPFERWCSLESRVTQNVEVLLELLDSFSIKATFFWLGWVAERHGSLVRKCQNMGHEIASHGYRHVPFDKWEPELFRQDIAKTKAILEDITGEQVKGFRMAGCQITGKDMLPLYIIKETGYEYDSSVFLVFLRQSPICNGQMRPYVIQTPSGTLFELPPSVVKIFGCGFSFFGGGYLRFSPKWLIRWGVNTLHKADSPLIAYVHPREVDPDHPRLPLSLLRRFRCYVNLKSTMPKLQWLCKNYDFVPMREVLTKLL